MTELIVDLFAGGGGASTGIYLATGRHPDIAVDFCPKVTAVHALNHPTTSHIVDDVWNVDPKAVVGENTVGLLWASPSCTQFSSANVGAKLSAEVRDLADVVIKWAKDVAPRVIIVENVQQFQNWGPITTDGRTVKERKGEFFKRWCNELISLGYVLEYRVLSACDYGVPTSRKRFFLVARCDGKPIVWPEPTHGEGLQPYSTFLDVFDWGAPVQMLNDPRTILNDRFRGRFKLGVKLFGSEPFVVLQFGFSSAPISSRKPHPTLLTSSKQWIGFSKDGSFESLGKRSATVKELCLIQGFPSDYNWGGSGITVIRKVIGNSVSPPVAAAIVRSNYP